MSTGAPRPEAWLEKGEHDLLAIDGMLAASTIPWDVVAFHAQQAAEKYLKGFLVAHGQVVPRIHDLVALLARCREHDATLGAFIADCERLTSLGWISRYPDSPGEPDESDARDAVAIARRLCDAVRQRMPSAEP